MAEGHLVSEYLETISGTALDEYQKIIRSYVKGRNGIYALYRRDRLYYVGLARDLRNRLKSHLKDKHQGKWDRFSVYLTVDDSHLRELESLVLRIMQPKGNSQRGKFGRALDLKRSLSRDIRIQHRRELDLLLNRRPRLSGKFNGRGAARPLAGLFARRVELRGRYKGREYRAKLLRSGKISFNGKRYETPAAAARAARKRRSNGWYFWQYERAPGDWVRLRELRHR